ncbi:MULTISPECIES: hypothetical protein [Bacillus cereus group]|uniref:Uncharacterized protein n=2 Tax=root TaxID=1 RepID=A0A1B1P7A2_9CAUD|nr:MULTISPECIES: hypothetical protein [Bacillus cereus group]YP_009830687.1 hypothetical protein HWA95_gp33 [Bacillus phage vB_BtS_BMBtp14]ANT39993.1 hypothetical protein BMBtpLA2_33 [Bacillus phage vB_BtS_BMBtp14]EEM55877.1 hypothetical protein bthur0007_63370 [Bacillus thuringiensis serovar monterrey BGSC 4AJ1]MEB9673595.1 hypothetical protein [Bacillus anthracis]OTX09770.1 hypothetical protein BK705_04085 [Bacillus thuringiensis serovar monterrey]OTX56317.1 hypothetical protein BK724_00170
MFTKEIKVTGDLVKGQIIGNWSAKSPGAFKLEKLMELTFDEGDLDKLITELQAIQAKIKEVNDKQVKN